VPRYPACCAIALGIAPNNTAITGKICSAVFMEVLDILAFVLLLLHSL
jgi:hypothetical protein